ncbi:MAG: hypothetical protein Q7T22_00510, partial [Serpentinimonas sp.]|nr:hypothetical protein [Serpentinimonas sp.]
PAELIDAGQNGLLAPFGDAPAFIEQARLLAGQPERVQALRLAARNRAQALDWGQIVQQTESLWLKMVRSGSGTA